MTKMAVVLAMFELSLTFTFDITRPHGENFAPEFRFCRRLTLVGRDCVYLSAHWFDFLMHFPRKARLNLCIK